MTSKSAEPLDLGEALKQLELALAQGRPDDARLALRGYLFAAAGKAVEGSASEAVAAVAEAPGGRSAAASVVMRAIGAGLIQEGRGGQLPRHVVALAEGAMPEFCDFLGVKPRTQTFEKFELIRGAHGLVVGKLEPLRTPYANIGTLIAARPRLLSALNHGQLRAYLAPFQVGEVADVIESLLGAIAKVHRMEETLSADVEECRAVIASGQAFIERQPSFLTLDNLSLFLNRAERALADFLDAMHGNLAAEILLGTQGATELQKRYPLHEEERLLRVVVPFRNDGPGSANDLTFRVTSSTAEVAVSGDKVSLGSVAPGEFSVSFDVLVAAPCTSFTSDIEIEWSEIGGVGRREELFEVKARAQRSDIDWAKRRRWNPYSTEPAQGEKFYGRSEQVEALVSRLLQQPMEPSYITGQKRVGKTSLARTVMEEAQKEDPAGRLTTGEVLWGRVAHEDPRQALRQLGEAMERIILSALPQSVRPRQGTFDGTLAPLIDLLEVARSIEPERRFAIILDEFDEMPEELYLKGGLAETFFANIRALTTLPNFCLLLVGGENMPYVMERQGQKLNKFIRVNLTYFSRTDEWDDFVSLVQGPSEGVLTWHNDAVSAVFNLTNGNPYFSKLICKDVASRAVAERDGDITAEEVDRAARDGAPLDMNAFMHLWEDGIRSPVDEREKVVLKRRRALAAVARCLRSGKIATIGNVMAHRGGAAIEEHELAPVLRDFVDRGVLVEGEHGFDIALPIFKLWLIEVGISRLSNDGLSEELSSLQQRIEDEAFVRPSEIVMLTRGWGPYRGVQVGPESVRTWLDQRPSYRDQRVLFDILKATRVVRLDEIYARLRQGGAVIRDTLGVYHRKSKTDRRSDVVLTYLDGEGKSGQRYASDYAEENKIHVSGILPPSTFRASLEAFAATHGMPRAIVIVDDVVGTGETLADKVTSFFSDHRDIIERENMRLDVYALFATARGKMRVAEALTSLDYPLAALRVGEELPSSLLAFEPSNGVFSSADAFDRAKAIATDVGVTIYRDNPLGFGGMAALLVLPNTVPNNSLPLLHSASKDAERPWMPLFPRIANG